MSELRPYNMSLHDAAGEPQLPSGLIPLSLLSFSDELRPEAQETLRHFAELGIRLKIISGDNPHTVAALYRQVGFAEDIRVVSGLALEGDVGIAMQSGSQATRSVADIVLLGDSFAALPIAVREGQRIIKGMEDIGGAVPAPHLARATL